MTLFSSGWRNISRTWRRHAAGHWHLSPADQPHIGDGVMWCATRARRHDGGTGSGGAGDALDARGLQLFGQAHGGQDGGEAARQPRRPRPRWTQEEHMMVKTPASPSALPKPPRVRMVITVNPFFAWESSWREWSWQLCEQCLGLLQVGGVKALGEPAVGRRQEMVDGCPLTLLLPRTAQAHGHP